MDGAGLHFGIQAVFAEHGAGHMLRHGKAGAENVAHGEFIAAVGDHGAVGHEFFSTLHVEVENDDLLTGAQNVARDDAAHVAETNKTKLHFLLLSSGKRLAAHGAVMKRNPSRGQPGNRRNTRAFHSAGPRFVASAPASGRRKTPEASCPRKAGARKAVPGSRRMPTDLKSCVVTEKQAARSRNGPPRHLIRTCRPKASGPENIRFFRT